MYRQFALASGPSHLVCWLKADGRVKPGVRVSLKEDDDPSRLWTVTAAYSVVMDSPPEQRWGGNLPKTMRTEA